nr:glycosyltransferase 87 family protein [Auraticoccus cholistanensis]
MVDLDVYLRAARQLLAGTPIYDEGSTLPFLYPPVAALLAVPMTLVPLTLVQVGWVGLNVALLMATMHRLGVHGWRLSLGAGAVVLLVEPVAQTFAFGQLGIILVALVVLDLVPGPRLLDRVGLTRRLPTGWASGFGAALKLTPGITIPYLFLAGHRRAAATALGTFVGLGVLAALVLPGTSLTYWGRLAAGDSGLGGSVIYFTNQSVLGTWLRLTRLAPGSELVALALSALVAALGIWAAVLWHRRGKVALAVSLLGVASLLASPVSWSHHFVWVVPLALVMLDEELPVPLRVLGFVFAGYSAATPFDRLQGGDDVELTYDWSQLLLDSWTPLLGVALLLVAVVLARVPARPRGSVG